MSDKTLYERLGGYDAIRAVVNNLLPRLQADGTLARFWQNRGADGIERCRIVFKPRIIAVRPTPRWAFQAWRSLEEADAPPDMPRMAKATGMS